MPCFHPLDAYRSPGGKINFKRASSRLDSFIKLPCGRCKGCRLEKSRQWAIRLMHEAQMNKRTAFVTLTYRDECLPTNYPATSSQSLTVAGASRPSTTTQTQHHAHENRAHGTSGVQASLEPRDLKLFTNRLNTSAHRRFGNGVRYYACGEYGERTHRPHYHIALFGEDFKSDRVFWKNTPGGKPLYRSKLLESLWEFGNADIGELTFESAAYIARYVMKKINGPKAIEHYRRTDESGCDYWIEPEFARMSRGKALGASWFEAFRENVYPHDRVIVRGKPSKPPRAYDIYLKNTDQAMHDLVKAERLSAMNSENNTPERLRAGEAILTAALNQRNRPLE